MKSIKLGRRIINEKSKPYFIAEIGVNHENSIKKAKKLIRIAKQSGADGVKFQSYKAEKIACKDSPYYWDFKKIPISTQFKLLKNLINLITVSMKF